jgi:radical SAM protein with 4Fe4S-binding SPASM domain
MHTPLKYTLNPDVILRFEPQYYDSYSAFNYKTVKSQTITKQEITLLKLIQANAATAEELAQEIRIKPKDCEKFLIEMHKKGLVEVNTEPTLKRQNISVNSERFSGFPIPFLSAPATVDFLITSRCNLHCAHCYADNDKAEAQDYPLAALEATFDQLEQIGVLEVRISGGEPLLHKDIHQIIGVLKNKRFRKLLLTNGMLLTDEIVLALKEEGITPTVSLDDCIAEAHNRFRGSMAAFERTLTGLALLQKHGVEYGVNCCLNKNNLNRIQDIIDLCVKYGAARIAFLDLKSTGRMRDNPDWMPTNAEYEAVLKKLFVARAKNRKIDVSVDAFLHCYPMQESIVLAKEQGLVSCRAGVSRLSIGSDGTVYPCNFVVGDSEWAMGNLSEASLEEIWFSPKWLFFRGQTKIENLHNCKKCKKIAICNDFYCRLLPYGASGDEFDSPPKCTNTTIYP